MRTKLQARLFRRLERLNAVLETPVDVASLAAFRLLFGAVMAVLVARFVANGWVETFFVEPRFHFSYGPFTFVRPLPHALMLAHFALLLVAAAGIALGFYARLSACIFCSGFTYVELIDKSLYLNHYYLVSLLAGFLCVLPAGAAFSVDAWRHPARSVATLPAWALGALRAQVGLVYVFAGVAKLNRDWLVEAQPLRIWLSAHADWPLVGSWLALPATAHAASLFGAAFDLGIVPLLSWRRTRAVAFAVLLGFHAVTGGLFRIGGFPWIMSAAATLFLAPNWPRRWLEKFTLERDSVRSAPRSWRPQRLLPLVLALHLAAQLLLPLRRLALPGPSAWTLEGFNFGWNVMVAEKSGVVSFRVRDRRSGAVAIIEPRIFLARFQELALAQDPDLVRQAAEHVAVLFRARGQDVAVYADAVASLNGHPARSLVDPAVDFTRPLPVRWILPFE
jgi:hypothetical protein